MYKRQILIKKRVADHFLVEAALSAGLDPTALHESPRNEAELEALESQKRLAEALNKGGLPTAPVQPSHKPNRFYERD